MSGAHVGYGWFIGNSDYDPDEQFYDTTPVKIKPYTGTTEKPLRLMERQRVSKGDDYWLSFEERLFRFYHNYRVDVESGRLACSNEDYWCAVKHEQYYELLSHGWTVLYNEYGRREIVHVTRENKKELFARIVRR